MIITELANTNAYGYNGGLRVKEQGIVLPKPVEPEANDICYCDIECEYIEFVFGDVGGEWWKNDKSSFLYKKLLNTDTVTIKLYKNDILAATITDNTYGIYTNGFTAQPLYVGFVLNWELVFSGLGSGIYQIMTTKVITGNTTVEESQKFNLRQYSDELANKTVRLEVEQNGNIINSQFDFTDLNWFWYYRIEGKFTKESPEIEQDFYLASNYIKKQIQDKIIRNWRLETHLLPSIIYNLLIEDNTLGNQFLITDYNIMNNEVYRRISLYTKTIELNNKSNNRNSQINITFVDKTDNLIKRNF